MKKDIHDNIVQKNIAIMGASFLLLAVILGAFGAHGLKELVDKIHIEMFKTGIQYQFYHGFAILITAILGLHKKTSFLKVSSIMFGLGIILFSGSLYLLALNQLINVPFFIGVLTPMGGFCFCIGWSFLIAHFIKVN